MGLLLYTQPFNNERANIKASATYTGSGWIVEIQRPLKTGDVLKQDVDFTDLTDRPFGVAIWNTSNNQHGIHCPASIELNSLRKKKLAESTRYPHPK